MDGSIPSSLTKMTALELTRFAHSDDISKASLGLAAINSLIEIDDSKVIELNAGELLVKIGMGKNISIVGHFPFTEDLKKVAKNLWVIEKWPRIDDYSEKDVETYLPQLSKILFDYGIDILSGSKVIDNEKALKYIREGVNFRQLKRTGCIKLITMTKINL